MHFVGGYWLWGPLMMIFWLAVLALIAWLVVRALSTRTAERRPGRAKDILAERYARGEVSIEEYREQLAELDRITQ